MNISNEAFWFSYTQTLTSDEIAGGNFDESFLFQLGEERNSSFKSLKSVYKPDKYLCVDQNERSKVTIISEDMPDFRIDDLCECKGNFGKYVQLER